MVLILIDYNFVSIVVYYYQLHRNHFIILGYNISIRLPGGNDDATRCACVDRGDQWLLFKPLVAPIGQQLATYRGGRGPTIAEMAMVRFVVVVVVVPLATSVHDAIVVIGVRTARY